MLQRPRHEIGPDEVHVWHVLADQAPLAEALRTLLDAGEIARMSCLHHAKDRELFLLSRVLMRSVLASYLGCDAREICFACDNHGKPTLRADRHGESLRFNLTHSRGAAVLAISRREVGVDVENRQRKVEYLALADRFFAPDEARHLRGVGEAKRPDAFFAIWTLKEAFVKGIGRGLAFPLEAFAFDLDVDRLIAFRPLADFVARDWHFRQFELDALHCGALAVHHPADNVLTIELRDWRTAFLPSSRAHGSA
jgi:4'-phosphopantetheinyl transferase